MTLCRRWSAGEKLFSSSTGLSKPEMWAGLRRTHRTMSSHPIHSISRWLSRRCRNLFRVSTQGTTSMWNTSARASVRCTIFMMTRTSRPASQPRRILIVSRAWPHGLTRFAPAPARLAARRKTRRLRRDARVAADSDRQRPKFENSRISFDNSPLSDGATTLRLGSGAGV